MKYRDLVNELMEMGYWMKPSKGPHEKWTNGKNTTAVPRHKEINEMTAKAILKQAGKGKV